MSDDANAAAHPADAGSLAPRLMLVFLCLTWGSTWPVMKVVLEHVPPISMRAGTTGIGALTLAAICLAGRRSFRVPDAKAWGHIVVASLFNVVGFSLLGAFAQTDAATSRVAILTYVMPIWTVVLAWLVLGERPSRLQGAAILLCAAGLAILISPLAEGGIPIGVVLALANGLIWAAGTVYLKWAQIKVDPLALSSWQVTIAFFIIVASLLIFEGRPHFSLAHPDALAGIVFVGVLGQGVAYGLWFEVVRRLPATTASLGVLGSPVIGVLASVLMLGERPTAADLTGFACIFAASTCVLLAPTLARRATD